MKSLPPWVVLAVAIAVFQSTAATYSIKVALRPFYQPLIDVGETLRDLFDVR